MTPLLAAATLLFALAGQLGLGLYAWAPFAWMAAIALFIAQLRAEEARRLPEADLPLAPPWQTVAVAAVLALGVFFRVYRLDLIPSGLNHDVAWNGLYGLRILQGEPYTPYTTEAWGRETMMLYLQALGIRLLGVEIPALIYPAVLAGILLLPIFYLWMRESFAPRLALAATFLLAVSGWHLVFSRIGWRAVLQPLVSTLAYWLFARGVRRRDRLAFAGAGAAAAAALYTYNAARLLPVLFAAFALYALWRADDRGAAIARWRGAVLVMGTSFAAVVAPMAWYAWTHWSTFQQRASATFALDAVTPWGNLRRLVDVYLYAAHGDDFFIDTPVLEWPVAVLFVFGFLWCLARLRDLRAAFLVLGWCVAAAPAFLSTPNANRMIGTVPFAYAFAALGGAFFARQLARHSFLGRRARLGFAAAVGIAATVATWSQYFGAQRRVLHGFYPEATVVGRYVRALLPGYEVLIGGANYPRHTLDYLTYRGGDPRRAAAYTWLDDVGVLARTELTPNQAGRGTALLLSSEGVSALVFEQMRRRFPHGRTVELKDWTHADRVFARALLLSPEDVASPVYHDSVPAEPLPDVRLAATRRGSAPGEFLEPRGLAIAGDGTVFVADSGNHRIQVFAPGGRLVRILGERGAAPGQFEEPSDVALDDEGKLLVADTWNHRVQRLEPDGFPLAIYEPPEGFFGPRGLASDRGRLLVADTGSHNVALFNADGLFVGTLGLGEGSEPGQLRSPVDVVVPSDRRVGVVDSGNHRLQVFLANGAPVLSLPVPGWSGETLREGYLTADGDAVLLTDPNAGKVWRVAADGAFAEVARGLRFPGGIANRGGELLVSERDAGRVTRLAALATPSSAPPP